MKLLQENKRCTWSQHTYMSILMYQGYIPPQKKNRRPIKNNTLNTELKEMGVFSAVAGIQLPNQLQKRGLPALFHLRCPSQSHQRSARGRTRLTIVTSISCRSFQRQLLYLYLRPSFPIMLIAQIRGHTYTQQALLPLPTTVRALHLYQHISSFLPSGSSTLVELLVCIPYRCSQQLIFSSFLQTN